ncbi:hypothetical protein LTSEADE_0171, partial [Salmonella enterica subsp. enterica serovar Adelaide str. A4-669]
MTGVMDILTIKWLLASDIFADVYLSIYTQNNS